MKNSGSATLRTLVAGLIIIAAGTAGFFAYRMHAGEPASELIPVAAAPAPAPAAAAPAPEVAAEAPKTIPDTLPDITLADRNGKPTKLSSFGGRPLMVNFWATWCAPCRREIPLLNKLHQQRKAQNAEIVGIAVDFREEVLQFVQKVPLSYPLLIGEEDGLKAAEAFGMGLGLPFSVFLDSKNRILVVKNGELHEDEANFAFDRLRDIDNGVLTREAAQALVAEAFKEMAAARAKQEAAEHDHGGE